MLPTKRQHHIFFFSGDYPSHFMQSKSNDQVYKRKLECVIDVVAGQQSVSFKDISRCELFNGDSFVKEDTFSPPVTVL